MLIFNNIYNYCSEILDNFKLISVRNLQLIFKFSWHSVQKKAVDILEAFVLNDLNLCKFP